MRRWTGARRAAWMDPQAQWAAAGASVRGSHGGTQGYSIGDLKAVLEGVLVWGTQGSSPDGATLFGTTVVGPGVGMSAGVSVGEEFVGESVSEGADENADEGVGEGVGEVVGGYVGEDVGWAVVGESVSEGAGENADEGVGAGVGERVGECVVGARVTVQTHA
jgi:hypothetical protein